MIICSSQIQKQRQRKKQKAFFFITLFISLLFFLSSCAKSKLDAPADAVASGGTSSGVPTTNGDIPIEWFP